MSSSLFRANPATQPQRRQSNDLISAVDEVKRQIGGRDPVSVLNEICMRDPQARAFVQSVQNMNPMQLAAKFFGGK